MRMWLSRLFTHEEINGGNRCPTYLHRWTIFQPRRPRWLWRGFGIYLHQFVGDDWSRDLHDHPKRFVSIGLRGGYIEYTPATIQTDHRRTDSRRYHAPWLRTFPAEHIHRITLLPDRRPCWTLVVVLWHVREWGFWSRGQWIFWREYVAPENAVANARKACQ